MSDLNYCGRVHVHLITLVYFLTKTDIISSRVNADDFKGQNKQIFVQLHFTVLRSRSIITFCRSGDFDSFLLYL